MKGIKKIAAILMIMSMVIGLLSGCTSAAEGKALYDAMVKSQTIKSSQADMQFVLRLDATGLNEKDQASFSQIKAMLNGAKMSMKMKQVVGADKTVSKAQADVNMFMAGMSMDMGVWVDMDLSGATPKLKEIVKLPAMFTAMDPSMAGKEYMVMDFNQLMNSPELKDQAQSVDFANTMKASKELQEKLTVFLGKYLLQYDPGFKFITDAGTKDITTPEGIVKAHAYQIKLDDKATKQLIRYTVNNLVNNKDAADFMVEYIKLVQKLAPAATDANNPADELSKKFVDFEKNKPALLAEFNKAMDEIENIKIIGDKGIVLEYAIDGNGYLVSQSGNMDFVVDTAKLGALESVKDNKPASTGVYNIGVDFNIIMYSINKDMTVDFPVITPENSINYADMLKKAEPANTVPENTIPAK